MNKPGQKPNNFISTKWLPELAYAVGLITSDGSLSKDGRHIDFTSKEKGLVRLFKKCLNLSNKIGKKTSGSSGLNNYFRIQFGSVQFYKWLLKIGLTSNKSKTLGSLKIPNKYFFDFLRGVFDGDGCIYSFWDKRWRSSFMFYIKFVSASPKFLKWLQKKITKLVGIKGFINKVSQRVLGLNFAKKDSIIIFHMMYHSDNIPFHHRKFTKAQKIFKINRENNAQVMEQVYIHG